MAAPRIAESKFNDSSLFTPPLNWRLICLPLPLVDYVVCHELAHLKEMNHGPRFWSLVEQLCPDWRARRRELRQKNPEIPPLNPPQTPA
ncbi:MAG: M48 family metallopeptidase [Desulfobulbus sp.]|nr:M48 family metallopeptidase [Desulfobulbus sp.]